MSIGQVVKQKNNYIKKTLDLPFETEYKNDQYYNQNERSNSYQDKICFLRVFSCICI